MPLQRVGLAAKLLDIGRSVLKTVREAPLGTGQPHAGQAAVKWLQKAFSFVELSDETTTTGMKDLKVWQRYSLHNTHTWTFEFHFDSESYSEA